MTTKEEVLQLAKDAGFRIDCADIIEFNVDWDGCTMEITDEITKLIELAKAQGAEEERTLSYEREKEIVRLACLSAADQAREHQKEIEAIRADLVKPIQADQKFKPVLYARFRNGEIDWGEDCVSSDNACANDYIEHQSDDEFYESVPLYSADTVRTLQLEAIRKTLEVAEEYRSDGRKFKTINPEEILNSLG